MHSRAFVAVALLSLAACAGESPTQPLAPTDLQAASASFGTEDAPAESGPVIRVEIPFWANVSDPEAGLLVVYGLDPVAACTGGDAFDSIWLQEVQSQADILRLLGLLTGDVRTSVWPFTRFDCALFTTTQPVATGVSTLRVTDNDPLAFARPNQNANTFGYMAHGALTLADGRESQFSAHTRCVWDGEDFVGTVKCTDRISLAQF